MAKLHNGGIIRLLVIAVCRVFIKYLGDGEGVGNAPSDRTAGDGSG